MRNDLAAQPWLSLYPPGFPAALEPRFGDMLSAFNDAVAVAPDRTAIRYFDGYLSYEELDRSTNLIALALLSYGIQVGDRVSIIAQNVPAFAEVAIASWKIGGIPVPSNPLCRSGEISKVFDDCQPAIIVCDLSSLDEVRKALSKIELGPAILVFSPYERQTRDDARVLPNLLEAPPSTLWLYAEARRYEGAPPALSLKGSDIGLLLYTSGTTGQPKGVMIRHDSLAFNAEAMGRWGELASGSRVLGLAPLFHITGFVSHLAMSVIARCELILNYRFEPSLVLEVIRETRPTYVVGAITAFNALMNADGASAADFASFVSVYSGGAAIPPSLAKDIKAVLNVEIKPCYGMTETSSPSHATPPGREPPVDRESGALAIGVPIFSTDAIIVDDQGQAAAPGQRGELWIRGPQIMAGYWNKPLETSEALSGGWLRTGDIAVMDAAGWFYLVDRKKDMINASGFKVWPREVEDCLHEHPAVREAAVVGIPDPYRGETVAAYISVKPNQSVMASELSRFCRDRLVSYKCPRHFHIVDDLPKTVTGKIQRNVVKEMAIRMLSNGI